MKRTSIRSVLLLASLSVGLSGCSIIIGMVNNSKAKKAEEEAQQAHEAELAQARADLAKKREAALDPAATPEQLWDYSEALVAAKKQEDMQVDPNWQPELAESLSKRLEAEGGLTAENAQIGYALAQLHVIMERPDDAATLMLGDDGLAEAAISWIWMAIHLLFPVALVLSYPWWRGRGDEVAAILVINHAVTFAVGIACLQWL
ncbi:MAG: hypothetical protein KC457_08440 [Myxococcales bacterium]|nr:hypothetical protein [Myxococcales bacterium]